MYVHVNITDVAMLSHALGVMGLLEDAEGAHVVEALCRAAGRLDILAFDPQVSLLGYRARLLGYRALLLGYWALLLGYRALLLDTELFC